MTLSAETLFPLAVLALLCVGLYALLVFRNIIKALIGLQVLAKAAILGVVLAGRVSGQPALGQSLAITVIVADTVVAIVGLALAIQVFRLTGALDIRATSRPRG